MLGAEMQINLDDTAFERGAQTHIVSPLEHVPKKLLDFFDQDLLRLIDIERFLFDHVIPRDREAL